MVCVMSDWGYLSKDPAPLGHLAGCALIYDPSGVEDVLCTPSIIRIKHIVVCKQSQQITLTDQAYMGQIRKN